MKTLLTSVSIATVSIALILTTSAVHADRYSRYDPIDMERMNQEMREAGDRQQELNYQQQQLQLQQQQLNTLRQMAPQYDYLGRPIDPTQPRYLQ